MAAVTPPVTIFISHSSKDHELTQAVVNLLVHALTMRPEEIRCTSLPGHQLPAGIPIEERLRQEVLESRVLTALLTPNSLQSSYVLFELGARWGKGRRYFPLFAAGITPRDVNDWLRGITGTRCSSETDLMSLISDIANAIGRSAIAPPAYLHLIKQVIEKSEKAAKAYTHEYGSFDPEAQALQQAQMKAADVTLGHSIADFGGSLTAISYRSIGEKVLLISQIDLKI